MRALRPTPVIIVLSTVLVILTAGTAGAQYSFDWSIPDQSAVKDMLILEDFTTTFTNTAAVVDSFRVSIVKDMPPFWQATICQGPICYPPSVTAHTFVLDPGEDTNLDFALTAAIDEGKGTTIATVESLSDPGVVEVNFFSIVTSGLEILSVDADGGAFHESFFTNAIDATGRTNATWTRSYMGDLSGTELANFDAVVWFAGTNNQALSAADRASLIEYVWNGGNLFLTGQNLARDYCDPGSPHYTPESRTWFGDLLGVDYLADNAATSLVNGVPGDPISDGMVLAINGGDGADNNASPDEIVKVGNTVTAMNYFTGPVAAVRAAPGDGRTFFAAFGFEGVATAGQRDDMMTSVLDWIIARFSPVGDRVQSPLVSKPFVTPNPFNPRTSLKFEVGGSLAVNSEVVIYDLRGRKIRSLFRGLLAPGPQTMSWDGRDDGGRTLASGVFLAQVLVGPEARTVKMTLAR
ncbi:MAG: hypothetical protein ABFS42_03985 [Candidatus Krumholzibacteriota bacterium]